jgi:hypothetical protein
MSTDTQHTDGRSRAAWALWLPGLVVALGAVAATAHGLFEVALAADVPAVIAWIYPLITDGLALVAYAATAHLAGSARRYAWGVVVLAAGLSGLAQAVYLAGGVADAPPLLRFGVGAWPAVAAAIVAHLLFLLGSRRTPTAAPSTAARAGTVQPEADSGAVQPTRPVQPGRVNTPVQPARPVQPSETVQPEATPVQSSTGSARRELPSGSGQRAVSSLPSPASDRARAAARRHQSRHGVLPSVRELAALAEVSQGSAGTVLKELREQPAQLQVVHETTEARTQP